MDIMERKGRVTLLPPDSVSRAGDVDPEAAAAAARMMAKSRAPLIVAGGGAIGAILGAFDPMGGTRPSRKDELTALKAAVRKRIGEVQPQVAFLDAIREALPDDGFLVDEITQVGYASWYAFPVYEPRHLVTSGYQGTLGYGCVTALGVKAANPDKPVVNLAGDGGFLYTSNEMATAAQYDIGLVTVLFNNNKFQNVQRQQKEWFGGRIIGSDLENPDFVAYAESFGIRSLRVDSPKALLQLNAQTPGASNLY